MERVVAIMAGGPGERLWPHSRTRWPKPFLDLGAGGSLVGATYSRLRAVVPPERILVLSALETLGLARRLLPEIPAERFLGEPLRRDTAAAATLALALASALHPSPFVLALVPADHIVPDAAAFAQSLAAVLALATDGAGPVWIGIRPTRPETGYGVIAVDAIPAEQGQALAVRGFVEKPDLARARLWARDGRHLWNTGICVTRSDWLAAELCRLEPALGGVLEALGDHSPAAWSAERLAALLEPLPVIPLDRALLERTAGARVVPAAFSWDDAGTWEALARLHAQDPAGNVAVGPAVVSATERSLVFAGAPQRLVVTHGVADLVVVDTPDSLLVTSRQALDGMQPALAAVRAAGFAAHLDQVAVGGEPGQQAVVQEPDDCPTVTKPWGREIWWANTPAYAAKRLEIGAGAALSLQYHERKHETLLVQSGRVLLQLGEQSREVGPGWVAVVPPGTVHRMAALSDAVVLEVSTPELDDVVRLEDRYGRCPDRGTVP